MPLLKHQVAAVMKRIMPDVEVFDTPARFLVRSRSNASRHYLVDIAANWGAGHCVCPDFTFNKSKRIRNAPYEEKHACWHIRQARHYWNLQTVLATATDEWLAEGQGLVDEPQERRLPAYEVDPSSTF